MKNYFDKIYINNIVNITILLIGVYLRIRLYLENRSFWLDESYLALNIIEKNFLDIFVTGFQYRQVASPGFFAFEKFFYFLFGNNEYAFRLYPLICGILSCVLFFLLLQKWFSNKGVVFGNLFFAISPMLIYYSSEAKQYSSDVFFTILILYIATIILKNNLTLKSNTAISILGAVIVWFSFSGILVLFSVAIALVLIFILRKDFQTCKKLFLIFFIWFISLILYHKFFMTNFTVDPKLHTFWEENYIDFPFNEKSLNLFMSFFHFIYMYNFLTIPVFFIFGLIFLFVKNKELFLVLASPIIVTVTASIFKQYPFNGRLIIFLIPIIIMIVCQAVEIFLSTKRKNYLIGLFIFILLAFYSPLIQTCKNLKFPLVREDIKPVLAFIKNNIKNGDIIYLHHFTQHPFKYYAKKYDFEDTFPLLDEVEIKDDFKKYFFKDRLYKNGNHFIFLGRISEYSTQEKKYIIRELKNFKNKRVWILFSHNLTTEKKPIIVEANKLGKKLLYFEKPGNGFFETYYHKDLEKACVYLYRF